MTLGDFLKEAQRQGCALRTLKNSRALMSPSGRHVILLHLDESVFLDDTIVLNYVRNLDLKGFDSSEESLREILGWQPSESEQT
jgi:hypothetical protein